MAKSGRSAAARRKNTRRSGSSAPQERLANQAGSQRPAAANTAPTVRVSAASAAKPLDPNAQYKYILGDLKQLGITAAAMFVVLIALAFVIR
jgi:hypothetical protein